MSKKFNGLEPFKQIIKDKNISKERLAEMWCDLNSWKIPEEFKDEILVHNFKNSEKGTIALKDIESIIGKKACLKEWRKRQNIEDDGDYGEEHDTN